MSFHVLAVTIIENIARMPSQRNPRNNCLPCLTFDVVALNFAPLAWDADQVFTELKFRAEELTPGESRH